MIHMLEFPKENLEMLRDVEYKFYGICEIREPKMRLEALSLMVDLDNKV